MCFQENDAKVCCFLGHREITETAQLGTQLRAIIEQLITQNCVDCFLFGSKSQFNTLCYTVTTELKEIYPHIKRIYVRAEFPVIAEDYREYLLESFEDTYYPACVQGAGRAAYIKRNCEMIDKSQYCVFYCNEDLAPQNRVSGTMLAMDYAIKSNKVIHILP